MAVPVQALIGKRLGESFFRGGRRALNELAVDIPLEEWGIPTDAVPGRAQAAGRAFSQKLHDQTDLDGTEL